MTVTLCLERAREAAATADDLTGDARAKVLEIAELWLKLADDAAKEAAKTNGGKS